MNIVNAIAKVRFASARPQRVRLAGNAAHLVEMLCMEIGQKAKVAGGPWTYYVVMGTARLTAGAQAEDLCPGQMATTEPNEPHTVANIGEGRMVCLAVGSPS